MRSARELLGARLAAAGTRASFGPVALPGLAHVRVADADLAALLADADGRLGPGPGVAWDGTRLRVSSRPGGRADVAVLLDSIERVHATLEPALRAARRGAATHVFDVEVDLEQAIDARARPRPRPPAEDVPFTGPVPLAGDPDARVAMVVGPGVVRRGAVGGLRAFAAAYALAVANTWGAKGVFRWDSPHHMGTCGLQADDFPRLGLGDRDLLLTSGLDPDEAPPARLRALGTAIVDLVPEQLGDLARLAQPPARAGRTIDTRNDLYTRLAAVAQQGYVDDRFPLHPARAVAQLGAARPAGGVLAADPGVAGLWVARTFPTSELGSVVVPATRAPGIAAALALCARRRGMPAAAVTTAPLDRATAAVCALADSLGLGFPLFVWGDVSTAGAVESVADHLQACAAFARADAMTAVDRIAVPVDWSPNDDLVAAAGPVTAWT